MRERGFQAKLALLFAYSAWLGGCAQPVGEAQQQAAVIVAAPDFYSTVDRSSPHDLRHSLHALVDDHHKIPYSARSTDTWDVLELADQDPNDPGRIVDVYRNASFAKWGRGNDDYNREHVWPNSYGFKSDGFGNYPYSDCHHLFLSDVDYNQTRGNRPFGYAAGADELTTDGGTVGAYPGTSNWYERDSAGLFETWLERRGDIARAMFYMDVRYEGGTHGITGVTEPDLVLTDDRSLIVTARHADVAYMGLLSVLLEWHEQDPVDERERRRNDVIEQHQGNRNPFIDHPKWVGCMFEGHCPSGRPFINELHYDNTGRDRDERVEIAGPAGGLLGGYTLVGYNGRDGRAYKTVALSGRFEDQGGCLGTRSFAFSGLQNGPDALALVAPDGEVLELLSYEGSFAAVDGPAAGLTTTDIDVAELGADPAGGSVYREGEGDQPGDFRFVLGASSFDAPNDGQTLNGFCRQTDSSTTTAAELWINELHYDNVGADVDEMVEIAGVAGTDLSGYAVLAYNGLDGMIYQTLSLTGSLPDEGGGFGAVSFSFPRLQNGVDALAFVGPDGDVLELLSYEGLVVPLEGPAQGLVPEVLPVSESSRTPVGHGLARVGVACEAEDMSWRAEESSPGRLNPGQDLGECS